MNDFLLNLFTGTDENRPSMMFPNLKNGIVYATDANALVTIPENELALKYGTNEMYPNAQKLLDDFLKKKEIDFIVGSTGTPGGSYNLSRIPIKPEELGKSINLNKKIILGMYKRGSGDGD